MSLPDAFPPGQHCSDSSECPSGPCLDGTCCAGACDGFCRACAFALTGQQDGVCAPVKTNMDPHDNCADHSDDDVCGTDGQCDGAGACRKGARGRSCAPASCNPSHDYVDESTCDGAGTCVLGVTHPCNAFPCTPNGCATPCTGPSDCPDRSFCSSGTCRVKKPVGQGCTTTRECLTGYCSPDGVCCDQLCLGGCFACVRRSTGMSDGTCAPVIRGLDPKDQCPTDPAPTCGRNGTCDGAGTCAAYGGETACGTGSCVGSSFLPAKTCDGAGVCRLQPAPVPCGQTACAATGCAAPCQSNADCDSKSYCLLAQNVCVVQEPTGRTCTDDRQCTSGFCVDGVCCQSSCSDRCQACSNGRTGGVDGMCLPVRGGTDPDSECEPSDPSTCGQDGMCDGSGRCRRWPDQTLCATGQCDGTGHHLSARTCVAGTCGQSFVQSCGLAACDPETGCRGTCASAQDCVGTNYCDGNSHTCAAQKVLGATCAGNAECLSGACVDGVCCNNQCSGTCVSCRGRDTGQQADGTCADVVAGTDPANECAPDAVAVCGLDGFCGGGRCRLAPAVTACGNAARCVNGAGNLTATFTPAGSCDGRGSCPAVTSGPCPGSVLCLSDRECRLPVCVADQDCLAGFYCGNGTCTAKRALGTACATNHECTNGMCSDNSHGDGVCCGSACSMACQGCSLAVTGLPTGTCAPRLAGTTTVCDGKCAVGYGLCRGGLSCQPTSWNFDQGEPLHSSVPYGWSADDMSFLKYFSSQNHTAGGSGALGFIAGTPWRVTQKIDLCKDDPNIIDPIGMDLAGKMLRVWVKASDEGGLPGFCWFIFQSVSEDGPGMARGVGALSLDRGQAGMWRELTAVMPLNDTSNIELLAIQCTMTDGWPGTMYFDDVSIQ